MIFRGILWWLFQISSQILLSKLLKFLYIERNIWNDKFRKSRVLPGKLVAMIIPDNLGNQKYFFMPHRIIFKITKFYLLPPKHLSTVVKNICGGSPMSNKVNDLHPPK